MQYVSTRGAAPKTPAVGVANAYDSAHLVALAIQAAGSTDGEKVREEAIPADLEAKAKEARGQGTADFRIIGQKIEHFLHAFEASLRFGA